MSRPTKLPRPTDAASPFSAPGLTRRAFARLGATGLAASWFLPSPSLAALGRRSAAVTPRGTAKNAILVFLSGAPSQIDLWDFKEGSWTPASFAPTDFLGGAVRFPQGLLPETAQQIDRLAFVRSLQSWALVHSLGQTWTQIARNPTGALGNVAPHLGAVVALESEAGRVAGRDILPAFVSLASAGGIGAGYLPASFAPFQVTPTEAGLASLAHPAGADRFADRWATLSTLDSPLRNPMAPLGKGPADFALFVDAGKGLMDSPEIGALFAFTAEESLRYGASTFGDSCLVATKLLAGRRGARFIQVSLGGWDHHSNIYAEGGNSLFSQAAAFDPAFASMLGDLAAAPGDAPGKSLLDETLVLVLGEFGRTVGGLNGQGGRDHFLRTAALVAGGGVRGGRVIGTTDATGAELLDPGWSAGRDIRVEDLAATIYSALGIDWTTVRHDDPLGRGFEYIPYARDGVYRPVEELFE